MSLNKMMDEFSSCYRIKQAEPTAKEILDAAGLIQDEVNELKDEVDVVINLPNVAKEFADVIYVAAQRMRRMGFDVDAIMAEVHRSNMSKTVPLGEIESELINARQRYPDAYIQEGQRYAVLRCAATNKVIKPTTYSTANITDEML